MHAIKKTWAEDLQNQLHLLLARTQARPVAAESEPLPVSLRPTLPEDPIEEAALTPELPKPADPSENVLRPAAFHKAAAEPAPNPARPPVSPALSSVIRATELLKEAEFQSGRKAQRALDLAFRTITQLESAETQLAECHVTIQELTERSHALARQAERRIDLAEENLSDAEDRVASLEAEVAELTARLVESRALVAEADDRAAQAQAQAFEAQSDLSSLAERVCEALSLRG